MPEGSPPQSSGSTPGACVALGVMHHGRRGLPLLLPQSPVPAPPAATPPASVAAHAMGNQDGTFRARQALFAGQIRHDAALDAARPGTAGRAGRCPWRPLVFRRVAARGAAPQQLRAAGAQRGRRLVDRRRQGVCGRLPGSAARLPAPSSAPSFGAGAPATWCCCTGPWVATPLRRFPALCRRCTTTATPSSPSRRCCRRGMASSWPVSTAPAAHSARMGEGGTKRPTARPPLPATHHAPISPVTRHASSITHHPSCLIRATSSASTRSASS